MKFGYNGGHLVDNFENFTNGQNLLYRVNNGVPNRLTQTMNPYWTLQDVDFSAFYAQEQWTRGRMTLQGALRYERVWGYFPQQTIGPTSFLPTALTFERTVGVRGYNNLMPRAGVAFDLFGDRKTSLKVNVGQYVDPASNTSGNYSLPNPVARVATTANRAWVDANNNWVADCDLLNRGRRICAPRVATPAARSTIRTSARRTSPIRSIPPFWAGGTSARATGRSVSRSSASCCPASRPRSATTGAGSRTSSSRTTSASVPRTSPGSASPRRAIPGCPAAAATWCPISTMWCPSASA